MRWISSVLTWLGISLILLAPAWGAQSSDPSAGGATTEVVIIGTVHQFHNQNPKYGPEDVRRIIVALRPSVICVELYSKFFTDKGELVDSILKDTSCPEVAATNEAAKQLGVAQVPYDREGRNEFYVETKYFERGRHLNDLMLKEVQRAGAAHASVPEVQTTLLLHEIGLAQDALVTHAPPEVINGEGFDSLIRAKRGLEDLNTALVTKRPGTEQIAKESAFFDAEWKERNGIMADNIFRIAERFRGRRVVVVTGAEHRCELRKRLADKPGIVLKEFWEVAAR